MSKTFKTPKGTELPLRDMRGKDYLDVQYRVLWMREEHADWGITTEIIAHDDTKSVVRSTIRDQNGKILAQGTKSETIGDFKDHLEKAETGATGRALALCGYGTQFAQELEEGERIVDGPREPKGKPNLQAVSDPGSYLITVGKFKGKRINECGPFDHSGIPVELESWAKWLQGEAASKNKPLTGVWKEAVEMIETYCANPPQKSAAK